MTYENSRAAEIGARIKLARESSAPKLTASAFARRALDVDASSLWRWENGTVPSLSNLRKIANATGATVGWLLTGEGRGPKKRRAA